MTYSLEGTFREIKVVGVALRAGVGDGGSDGLSVAVVLVSTTSVGDGDGLTAVGWAMSVMLIQCPVRESYRCR